MAWASSNKVGCGAAICDTGYPKRIVCNYGPAGNYAGAMPYTEGSSQGSDCATNDGGLCDCGDKTCNLGTLKPDCSCDCKVSNMGMPFLVGDTCKLKCDESEDRLKKDFFACYGVWSSDPCNAFTASICPHKCGVCPVANQVV